MNARQKCKQLKKQLAALYEDYVTSAMMTQEVMNTVAVNIEKIRESQVECGYSMTFSKPTEVTDSVARDMLVQLIAQDEFKQAVTFEGHNDQDTGEYIIDARVTVVIPEFDEEEDCDGN